MNAKGLFGHGHAPESEDDTEARGHDASEGAALVAALLGDHKACPPEVAEELRRLFGQDLAVEAPARLRLEHLWLLTQLIRTEVLTGRRDYVTTGLYDTECKRRREELGEHWPMATDLCRQYGHWLKAYEAAQRWWEQGGVARVPGSLRHARGFDQSYRTEEVIAAFLRFRREAGYWPTEWEFELWGRVVRRTAVGDPRIPIPTAVRKAFGGDFDLAKAAAHNVINNGSTISHTVRVTR